MLPSILSSQVCCPITSGLWHSAASAWLPTKGLPATATISCSVGEATVVTFMRKQTFVKLAAPKVKSDRSLLAQLTDVLPTSAAVAVLAFPYPSLQRMYRSASLPIALGPSLSEDGTGSHNTPSPALYESRHTPPGSAVPRLV